MRLFAMAWAKDETTTTFWHANGFRQVAATHWFCKAGGPHPSTSVAAADDFYHQSMSLPVEEDKFKASPVYENLRQDLPRTIESSIHGFVHTTPSLDEQDAEDSKVLSLLQQHATLDTRWEDIITRLRKTILHLAAIKHMPRTVRWILQQPFGATLAVSLNADLQTPCEYLEDKLDYQRRIKRAAIPRARDSPGKFAASGGHPPRALEVVMLLKGQFSGPFPSADECLRLRYGCACGECLAGIISPRVASALLHQAVIAHDSFTDELHYDGKTFVELNDYRLTHLQPAVCENLKTNKSMREGYANMFSYIAECLRQKIAPAPENVLKIYRDTSEWPPVTRNYLSCGGTVEAAFLM